MDEEIDRLVDKLEMLERLERLQSDLDQYEGAIAPCGHLERYWKVEVNQDAWCIMCAIEKLSIENVNLRAELDALGKQVSELQWEKNSWEATYRGFKEGAIEGAETMQKEIALWKALFEKAFQRNEIVEVKLEKAKSYIEAANKYVSYNQAKAIKILEQALAELEETK